MMHSEIPSGTVVGGIGAAVADYPDNPAVVDDAQSLSYSELWRESARIAHGLRARGVGAGQVVALAAERSASLLVGLVGILRAGAAVLPLDVTYPQARLRMMVDDSGAAVVVGQVHTVAPFVSDGREAFVIPKVFEGGSDLPADPLIEPDPANGCCLLYTSGSTGRPKGMLMPHSGLANLVRWQASASVSGAGSRTLQYGAISFDVAMQEIFATLISGGTLVCIDDTTRRNPVLTWDLIIRAEINRIFMPYVGLQSLVMVADEVDLDAVRLREIIPAGEQLQCTNALRALLKKLPECRLFQQYGPSEAHTVINHRLADDPDEWPPLPPIGIPIPGNRAYVLDDAGHELAPGEIGELYIAGAQLSFGYWRQPGLTAARFLPTPDGVGERMYRTGDLARRREDGTIDHLGRADSQVKIRGFRVELGEVESALSNYPEVNACGVTPAGSEGIDLILVAFVVADPGIDTAAIRESLRATLPEHMVPAVLHVVDALPQVPSGKLDRRRLRLLAETGMTAGDSDRVSA